MIYIYSVILTTAGAIWRDIKIQSAIESCTLMTTQVSHTVHGVAEVK